MSWIDYASGLPCQPYRLLRSWLLEKAQAARTALDTLTVQYRRIDADYTAAIASLAECGHELRRGIFRDCVPGDDSAASEAQQFFEDTVRSASGSVEITVHADPIAPIPWGLLHEGGGFDGGDPYEEFWAVKFSVAALYNGMKPRQLDPPRPPRSVQLLSALNQQVFDGARQHLESTQSEFIESFLARPVGKAFTTAGCKMRWQEVGERDCLIYFFGHGTGSELRLADADKLTARVFRAIFARDRAASRQRSETKYVLTVLNGCATVTGLGDDSFLLATADPGFCGFIGAEAVVPDRFALLFGQELLFLLLDEGIAVRNAMSKLWRKHRPMALFYGCYAHPLFVVGQDDHRVSLPNSFGACNFHESGT